MFIGDEIIKKRYDVGVFTNTSPGSNIPNGAVWLKKVEKCNNVSITTSVKLDADLFIYHNVPLKDVTKVDTLNRIYRYPRKQ